MTSKMRAAIALLERCDEEWAAVTITQPTRPVQCGRGPLGAFVNLRTARALCDRGLVEFSGGDTDPAFEYVRLVPDGGGG